MRSEIFTQVTNQEKDIQAIADNYKAKIGHDLWLAEGLQKDAIQNCWDARLDQKHGENWECGFSLLNLNGTRILCIADSGTSGLNGTKFHDKGKLIKILSKNESTEDLAYFLNSNWSGKSAEQGGNRGRGKTLFLAASGDKRIFFDSFRSSDNSYICGELFLDTDKQVKFKLRYDREGETLFTELTRGIVIPLSKFGTRIFIVNPDPSIKQAIEGGALLPFIGNSRWETIKKYNAKIFVDNGSKKEYVSLPYWYEDDLEGVISKEFPPEIIKEGAQYKTKRLVLRYAPGLNMPEAIRGIAVQRGGMAIERLLADELVHEEGMNDIYGWVEMESDPLEKEMKKLCEGPEHFDFSWHAKPAKYLKDYIRSRIRDFAKEFKIFESEQAKKSKIQKTAEEEALKLLGPVFKELGLLGKKKGQRKRKRSKRKSDEPLRLSIPDLKFPREIRRVNYGERIENAYVIPINDFKKDILVLVRVFVVSSDGTTKMLEEKELNLPHGKGSQIGFNSITISKQYEKGGYSFRARMISLEKSDITLSDGSKIEKGTVLYDRINQKFYVEENPPESGPLRFEPRGKDDKNYLFTWEPEGDEGYIVFYNDLHPRFTMLSDDQEKLSNYLFEQGVILALQIKLEELIADDDKSDEDFHRLIKSKDISNVWPIFLKKYSQFLWKSNQTKWR